MPTREQEYAAAIFTQVTSLRNAPREFRKKYGAMAHELPVLVHTAGLVQALAFVESRNDAAYNRLLAQLAAVLHYTDAQTLREASRTLDLGSYMRLTQQVLAALLWYKRFAESILKVTAGGDEVPEAAVETAAAPANAAALEGGGP